MGGGPAGRGRRGSCHAGGLGADGCQARRPHHLKGVTRVPTCSAAAQLVCLAGDHVHGTRVVWVQTSARQEPAQRVVRLLQEAKSQLGKEAADDNATCDKMVCRRVTNDKAMNAAIAEAEMMIEELMSDVEVRSGRVGALQTKVEHIKKGLAEAGAHFGHCRPREGACRLRRRVGRHGAGRLQVE